MDAGRYVRGGKNTGRAGRVTVCGKMRLECGNWGVSGRTGKCKDVPGVRGRILKGGVKNPEGPNGGPGGLPPAAI